MIDTHAHLNFQDFQNDYAEVIRRSFDNGIKAIINVGSNFFTSQRAIDIGKKFKNCHAAVGLHPIHVYPVKSREAGAAKLLFNRVEDKKFNTEDYSRLIRTNKRIVKAIGETGLDYFHNSKNKEQQKEIFLKHLELAQEFNLPLILHCRGEKNNPKQAYEDLLKILKKFKDTPPSPRLLRQLADSGGQARLRRDAQFSNSAGAERKLAGVIHCFSADWPMAQEFLDLGFYIGFTGVVTFPSAGKDLLEVIAKVPLEKILIETDCPFLAPQPVRGQRCEPWHVKFTAEKIAEIKKLSFEEVIRGTTNNAIKLFNV